MSLEEPAIFSTLCSVMDGIGRKYDALGGSGLSHAGTATEGQDNLLCACMT